MSRLGRARPQRLVSLTFTHFVAAVDGTATPTTVALLATTPTTTATGTSNTTPTAIALSTTVPAPTTSGDANTTPTAIALAASTPAPTASVSTNATPTAITLTTTVPAPTASGTANATPTAVALAASTPAPTLSAAATVTTTAITLAATTPATTATGGTGATTTPSAIALAATVPAPTASGDSNATPTAIALTVVVPAPTVTGTAAATPAAITLAVSTPAPTASADARAPPTAVALAATTPAPTGSGSAAAFTNAIELVTIIGTTYAGGWPILEDFTGVDGDPWDPGIWETLSGNAPVIDSNTGTFAAPAVDLGASFSAVHAALLDGQSSRYDIRFDTTITDTTGSWFYAIDVNRVDFSNTYRFILVPSTGDVFVSSVVATFGSTLGSLPDPFVVVDDDVVHHHIVRDAATGLLSWALWLNADPEPGTPQIEAFDSTYTGGTIAFGVANAGTTHTAIYDNVAIASPGAHPTAIAVAASTPAATAEGGSGVETFPNSIDLVARVVGAVNTIVETFTGTNGDPWNPAVWTDDSFVPGSLDLSSNRGRMSFGDGVTPFPYAIGDFVALNQANVDGYVELTIPTIAAVSEVAFFANGIGFDINPITGVVINQGGVTVSTTMSFADGDTIKMRYVVTDGFNVDGYVWTSGAQPGTPTLSWTVTSPSPGNSSLYASNNDGTATEVFWDNLSISSYDILADITGDANTAPSAIALLAVVPTPSTGSSSNGTATPSPVALSASLGAPTASGDANTSPSAIALTTTTPAPSASGASTGEAAPATIPLSVVVPAPTATGNANASPTTIAITVTVAVPTASGTATASPTSVSLAATTVAPTTSGNGNTSPPVVPVVTTTPPAAASSPADTHPTAIALTVVLGSAVTTGGATARPAAISITVSAPSPTTSGSVEGQALPATITVTITASTPAAGGSATTTPASVGLNTTTSTPTGTGGASGTPAAVAPSVTLTTPTTTGNGTPAPAAIPVVVSTPDPTATFIPVTPSYWGGLIG